MDELIETIIDVFAIEVSESGGTIGEIDTAIKKALNSAILAEREECAKICDFQSVNSISALDCGNKAASRIRARSQSAPQNWANSPMASKQVVPFEMRDKIKLPDVPQSSNPPQESPISGPSIVRPVPLE